MPQFPLPLYLGILLLDGIDWTAEVQSRRAKAKLSEVSIIMLRGEVEKGSNCEKEGWSRERDI